MGCERGACAAVAAQQCAATPRSLPFGNPPHHPPPPPRPSELPGGTSDGSQGAPLRSLYVTSARVWLTMLAAAAAA
eukprot:scaffold3455_cov213-Prasinococcus_capsulatus_cf.AAC.4